MNPPNNTTCSNRETVERIINLTNGINNFWKGSYGCAPIEAAELLTESRFDWLLSLTKQLPLFQDEVNTIQYRFINKRFMNITHYGSTRLRAAGFRSI
jgi:hypothetical protein